MKIIYIAGIGHSGSTLLEVLLANQPEIASCGELEALPNALRTTSATQRWCGCRTPIAECNFWKTVCDQAGLYQQPAPGIDAFRREGGAGISLREQVPFFVSSSISRATPGFGSRADVQRYVENNLALFTAFSEAQVMEGRQKPAWLIDSSKSPFRLSWLASDPRLEVHVLHIVRHPCQHAMSVLKSQNPLRGVLTQAARWSVSHAYTHKIARVSKGVRSYQLVAYEELALRPVPTIARALVGMGGESQFDEASALAMDRRSHNVAGNAGTRFHSKGVELKESWRNGLSKAHQRIIKTICAPTALQIGYSL